MSDELDRYERPFRRGSWSLTRSSTSKSTPGSASSRRCRAGYRIRVNGEPFVVHEPVVTGREILTLAGSAPGGELHAARQDGGRKAAQGRARRESRSAAAAASRSSRPCPATRRRVEMTLRRQFDLLPQDHEVSRRVRPAVGNDRGWLAMGADPRFPDARWLQSPTGYGGYPHRDGLSANRAEHGLFLSCPRAQGRQADRRNAGHTAARRQSVPALVAAPNRAKPVEGRSRLSRYTCSS